MIDGNPDTKTFQWLYEQEKWLEDWIIADMGQSNTTDKAWVDHTERQFRQAFPRVARTNPNGALETDRELETIWVLVRKVCDIPARSLSMVLKSVPFCASQRVKKWIENHQKTALDNHACGKAQHSSKRLVAEVKKPRAKNARDIAAKNDPVVREKRRDLNKQMKSGAITRSKMVAELNRVVTIRLQDSELRKRYFELASRSSFSPRKTQSRGPRELKIIQYVYVLLLMYCGVFPSYP